MKNTIKTLTLAIMLASSLTTTAQDWSINGNPGSGGLKLGGTTSGEGVNFVTEDLTRMTLTADGWLGIGTQNPDGWEEILYTNSTSQNNSGLLVTLNSTMTPVAPTLFDVIGGGMVSPDGSGEPPEPSVFTTPFNFLTGNITSVAFPLYSVAKPMLWVRERKLPSPGSASSTDEFDTKFIVMPDGSCGINITNPRAALDVRGSQVSNRPAAIFGSRAIGTNIQGANTGLDQYYTQMVQFVPVLDADGYNQIVKQNDQGMFFSDGQGLKGSNGASAFVLAPWSEGADPDVGGMRMDANGNTEFHGTLRATKMNVDAKWWADFVFDTDYELMSLGELEKFIEVNNHLPNVPSEEEVLEEGLDVANMQAIQQQKIEELTLYIIQQQKQIDLLIEVVTELKK